MKTKSLLQRITDSLSGGHRSIQHIVSESALALQALHIIFDCRSTVVRPSFDRRKFPLRLTALLALLLMLGVQGVWGANITLSWAAGNTGSVVETGTTDENTFTNSGVTFGYKKIYYNSSGKYLMFQSTSQGVFYNTTAIQGSIDSIKVTYTSGTSIKSKINVTFGTSKMASNINGTGYSVQLDIEASATKKATNSSVANATYFNISLDGGNTAQIQIITIYYTPPTRSVTWHVKDGTTTAGSPTTSVASGSQLTRLPTAPGKSDCDGSKYFVGWSGTEIDGTTNTRPTDLFDSLDDAPTITKDTNFYAVFATRGASSDVYKKITKDATEGQYILVSEVTTSAYRYVPNTTSSGSNPDLGTGITMTTSDGVTKLTNVIADAMVWDLTSAGVSDTFYVRPHGSTTIGLGTTASGGANIRISRTYKDTKWRIVKSNAYGWQIKSTPEGMYLAAYDDSNWRNYTGSTTNQNGQFMLFKKSTIYAWSDYETSCTPSCAAPTSPDVASVSASTLSITWTEPTSEPEDGYIVAFKTSNTEPDADITEDSHDGYDVVVVTDDDQDADIDISGLTAGSTYYWWMRSRCDDSGGEYSDWVAGGSTFTIPKITASKASITGLDYEVESGPSAAQSFTFSGVALNSGSITVTAPTNFEVSKDGSSFADSKTFTIPANGTPVDSTVYVRLKSSLSAATYGPSNVTISGGGASTVNVSVKGIVTPKLSSISVTTQPTKTAYFAGEDFVATGMVVTATYADASTANVTASCTLTGNTSMSAGGSVTISYGGKTTSPSINVYTVTVQKKDEDGETISADGVTASCSVKSLSASATAASKYVFKGWKYGTAAGTSISDDTSASTTLTGTPTGNVTVIAEFYKPVTIAWKVNGEDADAGEQTTSVARGTLWSALTAPSDPDDDELDCADTFVGWSNTMATEWYDNDNHSAPATLLKNADFGDVSTAITSPVTFRAVFATHVDGLINSTIIEDFEKQTASTTYNSTQTYTTDNSNAGLAWTMYYGCVSTDVNLVGTKSAQMRWYNSAATNYGYVQSTTALLSASHVEFRARVTNTDVKMDISYSADNGVNWTKVGDGVTFANAGRKYNYSYDLPGTSATNYLVKIGVSSKGTAPGSGATYKLTIDSIAITYKAPHVSYKDYTTKCSQEIGSLNEELTWPTPGTAQLTWDKKTTEVDSWAVECKQNGVSKGNTPSIDESGTNVVCTISGLTCDESYDFTITGSHKAGYYDKEVSLNGERALGYAITLANEGETYDEDDDELLLGTFRADASDACYEDYVTVTTTPVVGYIFDHLEVYETADPTNALDPDDDIVIEDNEALFTMPDFPVTIQAYFIEDPTPRIAITQEGNINFGTVNQYSSPDAQTFYVTAANLSANVSIALSGTNADKFSVSPTSITIGQDGSISSTLVTVTPNAGTAGSFSATLTIDDGEEGASALIVGIAMNVTPVYDIKWSVNGDDSYSVGTPTSRVVKDGKVSTLPTAPADNTLNSCANKFMGWSWYSIGDSPLNDADDIEGLELFNDAEDAPTVTSNVTYYAVFAESVPEYNYTYTLDYTDDGVGDIITTSYGSPKDITASDGGEWVVKAYKNNGMQVNIGTNSSIKIPTCDKNIKSIAISCRAAKAVGFSASDYTGSEDISYIVYGTDATSQTFDFTGQTVKGGYIVPKGSGATQITRIVVTFGTPAYIENYVTECSSTTARVSYSINDGIGRICEDGVQEKEGFTVCDRTPSKTGYDFIGWNDGSKTYEAGESYTLTGDVQFTATWEAINYTITYVLNDGTNHADNPATFTIEDNEIVLATPTRNDGHDRFEGWYSSYNAGINAYYDPITSIPAGSHTDITVYAKWTKRYHIEFYKEDVRVAQIWRAADEDISDAATGTLAGQGTAAGSQSAPTLCSSKAFVGWSGQHILSETNDKPADLKMTAKGKVTNDTVLHAVWATQEANTIPDTYAGTGVFERITDLDELTTGTYYVLYGKNGEYVGAMNNSVSANKMGLTAVSISDNKITNPATTIVWKLGGSTDAYTLYSQDASKYVSITDNAVSAYELQSSSPSTYTVTYTKAKGFFFKSNHASAGDRGISIYNTDFRCYGFNQAYELQLYKLPEYLNSNYVTMCYNSFEDNEGDGLWSTADNWSTGSVPTIDDKLQIIKPMIVDVDNAQAHSILLDHSGSNTGSLEIQAGKVLVVATNVKTTTDEVTMNATDYNDINIGSTLEDGTGALVMGNDDGHTKATVNFASKAKKDGSGNWINQFIGTPYNDVTDVQYNYYGMQLYEFRAAHDGTYPSGNTNEWTKLRNGDSMTPFMGYNLLCKQTSDQTLWMQGTLNASTEDVALPMHYNGKSNTENMFANSWTAPIDITAFETSDFGGGVATIYIFNAGSPADQEKAGDGAANAEDPGQYIVLPIAAATWLSSTTVTVIPSMQAFSVYATDDDQTLTLDYEKLVYEPAVDGTADVVPTRAPRRAKAEEDAPNVLRLAVNAASGYGDRIVMLEREDFTEDFDNGWDGHKMFGDDAAPQLYAVTADGNMAIHCTPELEGTLIGFKAGEADSEYTFAFEYDGDAEALYLLDTYTNAYTRVLTGNSYHFGAADNAAHNRFILTHYAPGVATGVENGELLNGADGVRKVLIDDHIYIFRAGKMFNATGALVK